LLVPYDGSEPADAALACALAIAGPAGTLTVVTVVDETAVIAQSANTMLAFDPTPLIEALDAQGMALLEAAAARCRAAGLTPVVELVHETPTAGIVAAIATCHADLVVMGTHARSGVARLFLGSTTEGVLRLSPVPVLTVRTADHVAPAPFATVLVALDNSEPAEGAAAIAAMLERDAGAQVVACHAVDTARLFDAALNYGFDPEELLGERRGAGLEVARAALAHGGLATTTPVTIVEGTAAQAVLDAAEARAATAIIVGTHGRRGLRRLVLGSVAEGVVRGSRLPVLVVPTRHERPRA